MTKKKENNINRCSGIIIEEIKKYKCVNCQDILEKPVLQFYCGHRLCGGCLDSELKRENRCPGTGPYCEETDLSNENHVLPDAAAERDMKTITTPCEFSSEGCTDIPLLVYYRKHTQECSFNPDAIKPTCSQPLKKDGWKEGKMVNVCGTTMGKLQLHETYRDDENLIRKVRIGSMVDASPEKTILLVGATGTGKSTLIDGMVNYIYGIKWTDDHIRMVENQHNTKNSQDESQTKWITTYTIPKSQSTQLPYTVTIVDTPGFGDTRGIVHDTALMGQLKKLFSGTSEHGLDSVNAVCFVARSMDARLTATQRYIFDKILSLFAGNIIENIQALVTFADGSRPLILNALKEVAVPFNEHFQFNNITTGSDKKHDDQFVKLFWDKTMKAYGKFFECLKLIQPKSLTLSSSVLQEREQLSIKTQRLQESIQRTITKTNEQEKLQQQLQEKKECMKLNQHYELTKPKEVHEKIRSTTGSFVTHCTTCDYDCHVDCASSNKDQINECAAMDKNGTCLVCHGRCLWSEHEVRDFFFKLTIIKVSTTLEEVKERYMTAQRDMQDLEKRLEPIQNEKKKLEDHVQSNVEEVTKCLKRLDEIALKKELPREIDYLEILINQEYEMATPGYEDRVQYYRNLIDQAITLKLVAQGQSVENVPGFNRLSFKA